MARFFNIFRMDPTKSPLEDMLSKSFWGLPFENILCVNSGCLQNYICHQTPNSMTEEEVASWALKNSHNPEYQRRNRMD